MMLVKEAAPAVLGQRYKLIDALGRGGMGSVFRVYDRLMGQTVALKRLTAPTDHLVFSSSSGSANMRLSLAGEFQTLASLRHPHIITVLDYGFDNTKMPYFTMELLKDIQTIVETGQNEPLDVQIRLLVEMLQALVYLHRCGIIHRDLKPGNVLTQDGTVKVLDFGLSIKRTTNGGDDNTPVGTLAYIAPEILRGQPASEASDLYAVGLIAYEIFAKRHPFYTSDLNELLEKSLNAMPDFSLIGANSELMSVLRRLLVKSPAERYSDANVVIRDLCQAASLPVPPETVEIRESFIQGAQFIGREGDLSRLSSVLIKTESDQGSAWLVGGESGIGKSRLLNELRTAALVRGILVLRGQAVSEGGSSYQLWRDLLRWLVLFTEVDDFEASVLKTLVPDISTLIEREIADAPNLDPQGAQDRLLTVIENIFLRQKQPTLIVLEDLHWSGSESLVVLARLITRIQDHPLMFLCSYRDDERPDLPASIPGVQILKLKRLARESIVKLSESMLGSGGREPQVINLLERESEGNIFFLIEVVRALAEAAGDLENIGQITLPEKVFAGGVEIIVQRRLNRVSETIRQLLETAAVLGRQIDLTVMRRVDTAVDWEQWLTVCANASILDVQEGIWRFAHDKLRERLLLDLSSERRRRLHEQVADALEKFDPARPAATLAYHWEMAGEQVKEAQYTALAGKEALRSGGYQQAAKFYIRALYLDAELFPNSNKPEDYLRRATWERELAQAYISMSKPTEALPHLRQACALLKRPVPTSPTSFGVGLLNQMLRQAIHRLLPRDSVIHAKEIAALLEVTRSCELLAEIYYFTRQVPPTLYTVMRRLNIAENVGDSPELASSYASAAVVAGLLSMHKLAQDYYRWARDIIQKFNNPLALAYIYVVGATYEIGIGQWSSVKEELKKTIEIATQLGDRRVFGQAISQLAWSTQCQGEFAKALPMTDQLYESAVHGGIVQQQIWALNIKAHILLRQGDSQQAIAFFNQVLALLKTSPEPAQEIDANSGLGVAYLREGKIELALQVTKIAGDMIAQSSPTLFSVLDGYLATCEVYFTLWEREEETEKKQAFAKFSQASLKQLHKIANIFPIGKPAALCYQGLYNYLSGNPSKAMISWQKSIGFGEKLVMPYDVAITHYEMGRHIEKSNPTRQEHLNRACEALTRLGTKYDLEQAQAALK